MRSKERLLTVIRGGEVDHVPFSPFLAYWWDFAPSSVTCNGQFAFLRELGADPLLRGFQTSFTNSDILGLEEDMYNVSDDFPGCQIIRQTNSTEKKVTWSTPVGDLTLVRAYSPAEKPGWYPTIRYNRKRTTKLFCTWWRICLSNPFISL